jgi:DMSO reductase anchor subunit
LHALPPTVFFVFLELAVGGHIVLLWADWRREVSRGFVVLIAVCLWLFALMALGVREGFPLALAASAWRGPETVAVVGFVVLQLVYLGLVWARVRRGRWAVGVAAAACGMLGLAAASLVHAGAWGAAATLVSLLLGATSLGAVLVGMVLGHWYLVTPTLSTRPLLGMTAAFLAAAVLQGVLLPLQMGLIAGDPARAAGTAALLSTYGLAFWLRVLVGIALPVALGVMTWQTCRLRSMMSATGLLYIAVCCVLAGEVIAKTLFFLTGIAS